MSGREKNNVKKSNNFNFISRLFIPRKINIYFHQFLFSFYTRTLFIFHVFLWWEWGRMVDRAFTRSIIACETHEDIRNQWFVNKIFEGHRSEWAPLKDSWMQKNHVGSPHSPLEPNGHHRRSKITNNRA